MAGFAIIRDADAGHSLGIGVLMLVDRAKSKQQWWTSDESHLGICYRSESAARFVAGRLRHGRPRVIDFDQAASAIRRQANELMHEQAMSDAEGGWDGHKGDF